jgi:alpha(1,3/1,4) fucosyltransferase
VSLKKSSICKNQAYNKLVAVVPYSDYFEGDKIFDSEYNIDDRLLHYIRLKAFLNSKDIDIHTIDLISDYTKIEIVIFDRIDFTILNKFVKKFPNVKRVAVPWEPEVVSKLHSEYNLTKISEYFDYVLTWNDNLIDNKKFLKFYWPNSLSMVDVILNKINFDSRKLVTQISSNKNSTNAKELYTTRKTNNHLLSEIIPADFIFYGQGWESLYKNYGGIVNNKFLTLGQFKFSLCFENMRGVNGYITEKIFDCFRAKTVPIYYGCKNISYYIPKNTFIDYRDFKSMNDLIYHIQKMDYFTWKQYINNAESFYHSTNAQKFSISTYIDTLYSLFFQNINRNSLSCYLKFSLNIKSLKSNSLKFAFNMIKKLFLIFWIPLYF